jgi:hypothetical protein
MTKPNAYILIYAYSEKMEHTYCLSSNYQPRKAAWRALLLE